MMKGIILSIILILCLPHPIQTSAQSTSIQMKQKKKTPQRNVIDELFPPKKNTKIRFYNKNNKEKQRDINKIMPTPKQKLAPYNVVVASFSLLYDAQNLCFNLRHLGHPALIYKETYSTYYVFIVSSYNEPYAQQYLNIAMETFPNAWLFLIDKNNVYYGNSIFDTETGSFDVVEQMPQFRGGDAALIDYLYANIKYPVIAEENGIQGRVVCTFIIERDGTVTNVKVARSVDPSLDKEAVRVIRSMPRWIPGKQEGLPVRVKFTLPITFRLQ